MAARRTARRPHIVMTVQHSLPEVWLRGPLPGYSPLVMPAAHCLMQCREEIRATAAALSVDQVWLRPSGVASPGFHLRHIAGSIDRLLTYARGAQLDRDQQLALRAEGEAGTPPATAEELVAGVEAAIQVALDTLRVTPESDLLLPRAVGRAGLPSNVFGLLFHIAEHTHRHTGQLVTTVRFIRGGSA